MRISARNRLRRGAGGLAASALLLASAGCTGSGLPRYELGEGSEQPSGAGSVTFSIEDVRAGSLQELQEMGVQLTGDDAGRRPWFITYRISLAEGDVSELESEELPGVGTDEWQVETDRGDATPLRVMGQFDCTPDGNQSNAVAADSDLLSCRAFFTGSEATVTSVTVEDVGIWAVPGG